MSTKDTVTFKNNRTGHEAEFPILDSVYGNSVIDIARLNNDMSMFSYDPGYVSTASCESAITYLDGDKGELLYRGYPIEQLAEKKDYLDVAYLLWNGELPDASQSKEFKE